LAVVGLTPLITPWLCREAARRPRLDILAVAGIWTAAVMGLAALAHSTTGFVWAGIACAPGEIAWFIVGASIVHSIAPADQRSRYHGLWGTALAVAAFVAPTLAAVSFRFGGQPLIAITTATVGMIGVVLCWPLARAMNCQRVVGRV
jgi:hypothetical protein